MHNASQKYRPTFDEIIDSTDEVSFFYSDKNTYHGILRVPCIIPVCCPFTKGR